MNKMHLSSLVNPPRAEPARPAVSSLVSSLSALRSSPQWREWFELEQPGLAEDIITVLELCLNVMRYIAGDGDPSFGVDYGGALEAVVHFVQRIERWTPWRSTNQGGEFPVHLRERNTRGVQEIKNLIDSLSAAIKKLGKAVNLDPDKFKLPPKWAQWKREQRRDKLRSAHIAEREPFIQAEVKQLNKLSALADQIKSLTTKEPSQSQLEVWEDPEGERTAPRMLAQLAESIARIRAQAEQNIRAHELELDFVKFEHVLGSYASAIALLNTWRAKFIQARLNALVTATQNLARLLEIEDVADMRIPPKFNQRRDTAPHSAEESVAKAEDHFNRGGAMSERKANIYGLL